MAMTKTHGHKSQAENENWKWATINQKLNDYPVSGKPGCNLFVIYDRKKHYN